MSAEKIVNLKKKPTVRRKKELAVEDSEAKTSLVKSPEINEPPPSDTTTATTPADTTVHATQPLLTWESRDHIPQERNFWWHAIVLGAGLIIFLSAIWTLNFLLAFFAIAAIAALFASTSRKSILYRIKIFPSGIEVEKRAYLNFSEVASFWIFTEDNPPLLFLKPRRTMKFPTFLLLENINSEQVRELLLNYVPEREEEFPFYEQLMRWMKL